jgi:excisionase family DNA binding protein
VYLDATVREAKGVGGAMKQWWRPDEAAALLGVKLRTIYRFYERGLIFPENIRGTRRLSQAAIMELAGGMAMADMRLMRVREAAALLQVSRSTIYRWLAEGRLREVRIAGSIVRLLRREVETMLAEAREGS